MIVAVNAIAADAAEAIALTAIQANWAVVGSTAANYFDGLLGGAALLLPDELLPEFPVAGGATVRKLLEESDAPIFCIFEVESDLPNDTGVPITRFVI